MKLSFKAMIIAGALFKGVVFLFISLMNLILRPYGGAYLAMLSSFYPGYDPACQCSDCRDPRRILFITRRSARGPSSRLSIQFFRGSRLALK